MAAPKHILTKVSNPLPGEWIEFKVDGAQRLRWVVPANADLDKDGSFRKKHHLDLKKGINRNNYKITDYGPVIALESDL
jgi:hypothetical protein